MTELTDELNWRYAVKEFNPNKKVSDVQLAELLEAARLAPSSFGLEPWKFLVIKDQKLKEKLLSASYNQSQITACSHLIVLCAKKKVDSAYVDLFIQNVSKVRDVPVNSLKGYSDMIKGYIANISDSDLENWSKKQVYIALGFLMQAAARLKIDSCPMEGFSPKDYDKILGLKDYTSTVLLPIGYRLKDGEKKARFELGKVVEFR